MLGDTSPLLFPWPGLDNLVLGVYSNLAFSYFLQKGIYMKRRPVNKHKSARSFRRSSARTKSANVAPSPQRGGWRL